VLRKGSKEVNNGLATGLLKAGLVTAEQFERAEAEKKRQIEEKLEHHEEAKRLEKVTRAFSVLSGPLRVPPSVAC
jgi:hypothetical protein